MIRNKFELMRYLSGLSDPLVGHYAGLILEGRSRRVTLDLVILINTNRYVALLISSGHQHKFTTNKIIWDRNNQSVTSVISRSRPVLVTPRLISCCHSPRNYLFWDAWLSSDGECWKDVPLTCEPLVFYLPKVDLVKVNISTNINVVLHEPSISGGAGWEEGGGRPRQCFVISLN